MSCEEKEWIEIISLLPKLHMMRVVQSKDVSKDILLIYLLQFVDV